ncbi:uncharacterized protein DSM5745_08002 [Aspergillus mulundensis]|uniref:Alpha/beta hydrolase fold-3 domain-containing protein n=1 Tax=Aspergillus mulundensis TaxID=1810919 RepID=A0A3D8R9C7_9EURO|nr:Uncharacterized protein DSM5745_08002 [Aspergillus mulundensis]RDW70491.1 Uncharacterized protein DSM5745_08002 [Aspergillus mulundensis]
MAFLATLWTKTRLSILTPFVRLLRAIIVTLARLAIENKPNPDVIQYIPSLSTTTATSPTAKSETTIVAAAPVPTHEIKVHIYNPSPLPPSAIQAETPTETCDPKLKPTASPSPVLITACGSGFIFPGLGLDASYCRLISSKAAHTVVDVEYRLAPEHPFPCAIEDFISVVTWVQSQPERFDTSRISIGGFSAGGNIAASVPANLFPPGTFANLVLFYPVLDASISPKVKMETFRADMENGGKGGSRKNPPLGGMGSVPACLMKIMQACYLESAVAEARARPTSSCTGKDDNVSADAVLKDPRISPTYADASRFPARCLFVTAEYDCLAKEAEDLGERIRAVDGDGEAGRTVIVRRVLGCGHQFDKGCKPGSEREKVRDEVYATVVDLLKGD